MVFGCQFFGMAETMRRRRATGDRARPTEEKSRQAKPQVQDIRGQGTNASLASLLFARYRRLGGWTPNPVTVFAVLLSIRSLAAFHNGIADCDETYNYWEPLHMLLFGSGMQTWEYSPDYALRSYFFLLPYAGAARIGSLCAKILDSGSQYDDKLVQFYSVRFAQAVVCAIAELLLYDSVVFRFGKETARMFFIFLASSPGLFRASTELLPSSFAMVMFMFACSNWFVGQFSLAIAFTAIAACLGWPFAALLGVPMALHVLVRRGASYFAAVSVACGGTLAVLLAAVDSSYYGKLVLAPLNIVRYNVFPVEGAGPDIYGTEPWTFYFTNLVLNCNVSFVLYLLAPCVWLVMELLRWNAHKNSQAARQSGMTRLIFLSPSFIWFAVFLLQPHKEERFMAPMYPLVALIAAVVASDASHLLFGEKTEPRRGGGSRVVSSRLSTCARVILHVGLAFVAVSVGASRAYMHVYSFHAPFSVFRSLGEIELQNGAGPRLVNSSLVPSGGITVCMGEEWYRFPSHFFMPGRQLRLRFYREGFHGLLPKPFVEDGTGTQFSPPGMNMLNKEDPNQYVDDVHADCHYIVDLDLSHRSGQQAQDDARMRTVTLFSEKILDLEASPAGFRSFWIPGRIEGRLTYGKFRVRRNLNLLPLEQ